MKKKYPKIEIKKSTETTLQIFKSDDFGQLTVLEINDEPWFVAKEIAGILGYGQTNNMTARLDDDQKLHTALSSISSNLYRKQIVINESGLYCAIFGSQKPEAKVFRRWIADEVLPSIRKTGFYSIKSRTPMEMLESEYEARKKALLLEEQAKIDKPKVIFADHVVASDDDISVEEFAKVLHNEDISIGRNRLYDWFRDNNFIMSSNLPYQNMIERGYFNVIEIVYDYDTVKKLDIKTMITPNGQIYFTNKIKEQLEN